jgi:hypothetical protein
MNHVASKYNKFCSKVDYPVTTLDFMACGDFTLMSKQNWMAIKGYVELDMYSLHIDSLSIWSCAANGMMQEIFPPDTCVFHISHQNGWESEDVIQAIKFLEGKPCLDYSLVQKLGMRALKNKETIELNISSWGFAENTFEEFTFGYVPGQT